MGHWGTLTLIVQNRCNFKIILPLRRRLYMSYIFSYYNLPYIISRFLTPVFVFSAWNYSKAYLHVLSKSGTTLICPCSGGSRYCNWAVCLCVRPYVCLPLSISNNHSSDLFNIFMKIYFTLNYTGLCEQCRHRKLEYYINLYALQSCADIKYKSIIASMYKPYQIKAAYYY